MDAVLVRTPPLAAGIPAGEKGSAEAEVATIVAKANDGTVTPEEGARGIELAQRLGKLAGAGLFGVERFAFENKPVQRGGFFRLPLNPPSLRLRRG